MSKEATRRAEDKSTSRPHPGKGSMQVYLRYLRSDTEPVAEEDYYSARPQLNVWRTRRTLRL